MSDIKILFIGATGYIGGTVLHRLLTSPKPLLQAVKVTALVRGADRARQLKERYGDRIEAVPFKGLDDTDLIRDLAAKHDVVINGGTGYHTPSAVAMVEGLAAGQTPGDGARPRWMLHTSGVTNVADRPITDQAFPGRELDDGDGTTVYDFEKAEEQRQSYLQRATELAVIDASEAAAADGKAVRALSVSAPFVWGPGEGAFQTTAVVFTIFISYVLEKGHGFQLGDGSAVVNWVHVADLADFYVLCVEHIARDGGAQLPYGKKGIVFPASGHTLINEMSRRCVEAAFRAGVLPREDTPKEPEVREIGLEEAAKTTAGNASVAERAWAGHYVTKVSVAPRLGWKPVLKDEALWNDQFDIELRAMVDGKRSSNMGNLINAAS